MTHVLTARQLLSSALGCYLAGDDERAAELGQHALVLATRAKDSETLTDARDLVSACRRHLTRPNAKLKLPDGSSNTWGDDGWGIG